MKRGVRMSTEQGEEHRDPLVGLLEAAEHDVLITLVRSLAGMRPDVRRACFEYLEKHVASSPGGLAEAEGELAFSIWEELEPDLAELDEYGGGGCDLVDHVGDLLWDLQEKLKKGGVSRDYRRDLLDEVIPYISSRNSGMEDPLYDVAYAACYDDDDLRDLAVRFERIGRDWPIDHARRIYRQIGDNARYLELRARRMEYGVDYHDLATFYWENGEREKAVETACKGLDEGEGKMDELRLFLAERASESGDREQYLRLHFEQAIDRLTCEKYKAFKEMCTPGEWREYEPRVLERIPKSWQDEQLKIYVHRKEYERALSLLQGMRPRDFKYGGTCAMEVARRLEKRFPDEILAFYKSVLGSMNCALPRNQYAAKARLAAKVRHMYIDILKAHEEWTDFARRVRQDNLCRPAFQEEFARVIPGWKEIT